MMRRELLGGTVLATNITIAGCLSMISDGELEHSVYAINRSEQDREMQIRVFTESDETLFETEYSLEAGTRSTEEVFTGEPASMEVVTNGEKVDISIVPEEQCQDDSPLVLSGYIDHEEELEPSYFCTHKES